VAKTRPDVTEPKHYGMHRHFTEASGVPIFGGSSERLRLRHDGGRAAVQDREEPGERGGLRDALSRDGDSGGPGVHGGRPAVSRDEGRAGQAGLDLFA
jgi:hypothetical protein